MIKPDKIICDPDSVPINVPTNVTSAVSTNFYNKNVRYKMGCYILHTILLLVILLFIVDIICYHYVKYRSILKNVLPC